MNRTLSPLKPFQYQQDLRDYLREKKKLWSWFSEDKAKANYVQKFKNEILKDSYRMNKESHPEIFNALDKIKSKLNLPLEIHVYQEQMSYQNNVSILFDASEAHIVLSGRIVHVLSVEELKAVLAHEIYHYYFFAIEEKSYEIADRIITSIANHSDSSSLYVESARLFKLYTELYCDRGSYEVLGDINPMISALVKLHTGVDKVDPKSYVDQATEILNKKEDSTQNQTHPETYIRAKALSLWKDKGVESQEEIVQFIEPVLEFEKLNIFSQDDIRNHTKSLIDLILKPNWNRTERLMNLRKEYFPRLTENEEELDVEAFFDVLSKTGDSTKKYMSYVLLDFALADPDQGNTTLGYAFELAENAGLKTEFKMALKKEVKLTERALIDLQKEAMESLNKVNESKEDSLYGE